jgi:hypothetical protein
MRRAAAISILLTALALPGGALAQSAGDEQYSDPFGPEEPQQQEEQPQAPAQPAEPEPAPAPAPAPAGDSSPPVEESSDDLTPAPAQSSDPSLPVTGFPALAMLIAGAGLFAAGAVVRRRL